MLSIDSETVSGVANTITVSANIHGLGDPSIGDATEDGGETIDVLGGGAAVGVDIAGEAGTVLWVADEEDSLDGVHVGAGELGHGVDGGGGALGVALEDEAHVGVGAEGGLDLVDNVLSAEGGVLAGIGKVDSVVDGTAGDLGESLLVHGAESSRRTLKFTSTTGGNDGVLRAGSTLLDGAGDSTCSEEDAEESTLEADVGEHVDGMEV